MRCLLFLVVFSRRHETGFDNDFAIVIDEAVGGRRCAGAGALDNRETSAVVDENTIRNFSDGLALRIDDAVLPVAADQGAALFEIGADINDRTASPGTPPLCRTSEGLRLCRSGQ